MKLMLVGDTHGDLCTIQRKMDTAKRVGGIQRLLVLGDFGLWWGHEGVAFLDSINQMAAERNLQVFAIGGNHECWELWDHIVKGAQEAGATSHGWAYARTHVLLSPKVHKFRWGNRQFVVAGGAVSIDKKFRLEYEAQKGKKIWSPNEQLTDNDVDTIASWVRGEDVAGGIDKVDYLLTHDCSDKTPFYERLKPDHDSKIHRQRIDSVLKLTNPSMHFHGHMHTRYNWMNFVGERDGEAGYVQTYGLECNDDPDSWGVLDLATNEFVFASDFAS